MSQGPVSQFIDLHYRHFNAAALKDAAEAYSRHLDQGGIMLMTLAGAMSTAVAVFEMNNPSSAVTANRQARIA